MVEDTHDGEFSCAAAQRRRACGRTPGRSGSGPFTYALSEQSLRVREAANAAMKRIAERNGPRAAS